MHLQQRPATTARTRGGSWYGGKKHACSTCSVTLKRLVRQCLLFDKCHETYRLSSFQVHISSQNHAIGKSKSLYEHLVDSECCIGVLWFGADEYEVCLSASIYLSASFFLYLFVRSLCLRLASIYLSASICIYLCGLAAKVFCATSYFLGQHPASLL